MRKCRYQGDFDCTNPLLKCEVCLVHRKAVEDSKRFLKPAQTILIPSSLRPYIKYGTKSGKPGVGIEIGIKGTF